MLLYGTETWAVKARGLKRLSGFHNRCVRSMAGVSRYQQWKERISSRQLAMAVGMQESMADEVSLEMARPFGLYGRRPTAKAATVRRAPEKEALSWG